jgi:hypothetical protein
MFRDHPQDSSHDSDASETQKRKRIAESASCCVHDCRRRDSKSILAALPPVRWLPVRWPPVRWPPRHRNCASPRRRDAISPCLHSGLARGSLPRLISEQQQQQQQGAGFCQAEARASVHPPGWPPTAAINIGASRLRGWKDVGCQFHDCFGGETETEIVTGLE